MISPYTQQIADAMSIENVLIAVTKHIELLKNTSAYDYSAAEKEDIEKIISNLKLCVYVAHKEAL